jgi:hypothetical protein
MKNAKMTKRTAEFVVAIVATVCLVWAQNYQSSFRKRCSGYVPANFQAEKTNIVPQGPVSVEG